MEERNRQAEAEYQARIAEMESEAQKPTNPSWPAQNPDAEWEVMDLSTIPLENQTAEARTRADLMTGGMLLVNEWHSRPDDFDESGVVSVAKRYKGDDKWDTQNTYFQNKVTKLSSKYSGDALIAAAKKEVNYPGTSEYNSGLAFELRLYDRNDPEVSTPKYSTTAQGKWMSENCWQYGIVFRFPQNAWPLESSTDKSFKTGVSKKLNLYRYVGKGNAAIMHYMDFTMEEYIEYLSVPPARGRRNRDQRPADPQRPEA